MKARLFHRAGPFLLYSDPLSCGGCLSALIVLVFLAICIVLVTTH